MSMPPKNPLSGKGNYFDVLCQMAVKHLDIGLCFDGYDEVIEKYQNASMSNREESWELAKELNAWSEYCATISNYIQNQFLDAETSKVQIHSEKSIKFSEKNVSAGERFANTDDEVVKARLKRNVLKSLYDSLVARKDFLDKAFYQCKNNIQQVN